MLHFEISIDILSFFYHEVTTRGTLAPSVYILIDHQDSIW